MARLISINLTASSKISLIEEPSAGIREETSKYGILPPCGYTRSAPRSCLIKTIHY